ncbi:MAG: SpoIIIAH-like family protein [Clostridia bacterium]|nr:SpoIIIAH-like family protein [Clostridia bacterium]
MTEFILKHRNALLLLCLLFTLAASWFFTNRRLTEAAATVSLPVEPVSAPVASYLDAFRARQEEAYRSDMAALQALCDQENLSSATREDAAAQLRRMVDTRQTQLALEGALAQSGVSPCVAVISPGSVTVVTEKASLSDGESALVMTLAQAHAGVEPSGVRVMTAGELK